MTDRTITITDVRRSGHCTRGARRWFEANHLDFTDFLKHGIPASKVLATGDAMVHKIIASAEARDVSGR